MSITRTIVTTCVLTAALPLLNAGCTSDDPAATCAIDADCKGDRICSAGLCVADTASTGGSGPLGGAGGGGPGDRQALAAYLAELPDALCAHLESCGFIDTGDSECLDEAGEEIDGLDQCDALVEYYVDHQDALDRCLSGSEGNCDTDDIADFCPAMADVDLEALCAGGGPEPTDGGSLPTNGAFTTTAARAVGAWASAGTNCASGTDQRAAYFLCPGGRIRGAGEIGNVTELVCGTYTTSSASLQDCDDRFGCFDKISATVTSTLILAGEQDVATGQPLDLFLTPEGTLFRATQCNDGSSGTLLLDRVSSDVEDDYCFSEACPVSVGSGGGYGSCGTDCDCGYCWYCESGQCRYGGEGPSGCYRGCSG